MPFNDYKTHMKKVISASRRIDMVGFQPDQFVNILNEKCPPENVHTLVIWTKSPQNIFSDTPLFEKIKQYDQLFFHFTVTGMGGTALEPRVPSPEKNMPFVQKLVDLAGDARRIRFRFDPIVHLKMPNGEHYSNLDWFEKLAPGVHKTGVRDISISWMSTYRKVVSRLKRAGFLHEEISESQWQQDYETIMNIAEKYGFVIHGCSVPNMPRSRCIDGFLLSELHPNREPCSTRKAKGQRTTCGCTESWDIGWYYKCWHGCVYCYANPAAVEREVVK